MFNISLLGQISSVVVISVLLSLEVFAVGFTDEFTGSSLAAENWDTPSFRLEVENGRLHSNIGQSSIDTNFPRIRIRPQTSGRNDPNLVNAIVNVKSIGFANNSDQVFARIGATFYNTLSANSEDSEGDLFGAVYIGDKGTGLEAWWQTFESTSPDFSTAVELIGDIDTTALGPLAFDTDYFLQIAYDGDKTITFTISESDGTTNRIDLPVVGSDRAGSTAAFHTQHATGLDFSDGGDGSDAGIAVEFDDAFVQWDGTNSFSDDFSGVGLDSNNWREDASSVSLESGVLAISVTSESPALKESYRSRARLADTSQNCLAAHGMYRSESNVVITDDEHRGRVRLQGNWYNDTPPPYDSTKGDIFGRVLIESRNGALRASAYIFRADPDVLPDEGTDEFFQSFRTIPKADTFYPMSIELDEAKKELRFKFNGETIIYNILTDIHPVSPDNGYKALSARLQEFSGSDAAEGFVLANFDHVFSGDKCPDDDDFLLLLIPSIISATKK